MTGYGRAVETIRDREITVELRSVNNRFLDCTVKMPRAFSYAEEAVKQAVKQSVSRGKVDVFITVRSEAGDEVQVTLNKSVLQSYLTAMHQMKLSDSPFGQAIVNILPRGLSENSALLSWLSIRNEHITKVTADYAFPIFIGDLAIGGNFFSIKRLVVNPHFDYTFAGGYGLFSAGAELILDLNSILTLEWPCSFGVTYSYNGGNSLESLEQQLGTAIGRHFVGPTFNVSF